MSDRDPLDALFEGSEAAPAKPEPAPQATPEAQPANEPDAASTADQPRDKDGRFASKANEPAPQPASTAPAPVAPQPQPPQAQAKPPIDPEQFKGYIEEREKRQAEKARADRLEAELEALRQQQSAPPIPSVLDDPDGYHAHLQEQRARERIADRINLSEVIVRQSGKYQPDEIDAALQWGMQRAKSDEGFRHRAIAQPHPVEWTIREHKRDQILSQIGDKDPKEWARELLAADMQSPQPSPAASPPIASPTQPAPTPSLAAARSAGAMQSIPLGGEAAFEAMFRK